jgi:glyoxalase family protein
MMRTNGFHHAGLVTAELGRAEAFYRDVLGLSRLWSAAPALVMSTGRGTAGTLLAFEEQRSGRRGGWGVGGVHHIALGTADEVELLQWKRWLTDHGVPVSGPYDRRWFRSIYFTDPDGQVLEIATRGPGYDLDEPAHALGERDIDPGRERIRGARDESAIAAATHPEPVPEITDAMRLDGIHHISGITGPMEAADAFLPRALGLRLVKRTVNQDDAATPHWFWASYDGETVAPHSAYTLFGWRGSEYRARPGVGQTSHVAFRAADLEELDAWREHLQAVGIDAGDVVRRGEWQSVPFTAPDGMRLELTANMG